jgi:hypothetical protein
MTRTLAACALGATLLGAAGCIPEEGPMMEPGSDCMECHDGGEARRWTAAGTFRGQGSQVVLQDAAGRTLTLHTNRVGNFWTAEPLAFPLRRVSVNGSVMPSTPAVTQGSCNRGNACHGGGSNGGD